MANYGDDCFFYYYSTCTRGDSCPFRHCEAARANEIMCTLWQEGHCFHEGCKFRHMKITKNRKEIPCYWETQPAGCLKPHCAFFHEKPRLIGQSKTEESQNEEQTPSPAPVLPNTANPQLRGIIKTETQEPVPSPTHPPVVINPADDDEDEDDQFSEEGDDGKLGPSPKKMPKSGDMVNFGVSTLEEIRLRKALKASMKRAGYPVQSAESLANKEKENIRSFRRQTLSESKVSVVLEESGRPRGSMAERLGRKIPTSDYNCRDKVPLKRSLAERLGEVVDEEQPLKVLKPVKERLGLLTGPGGAAHPAETCGISTRASQEVHIKTLEEIQREKSLSQNHVTSTNPTKATCAIKRVLTGKVGKTFLEVFPAKRLHLNEEHELNPSQKKPEPSLENALGKSQVEPDPEPTNMEKVKVKTLEEIRREKSSKVQQAETRKDSDTESSLSKVQRIKKAPKLTFKGETTAEPSEVTEVPPDAAPEACNFIKVKTFEEIMREKRLRKQEMEEHVKSSAEAGSCRSQTSRDAPNTNVRMSSKSSTPRPKGSVRKLITVRPEAPTALSRTVPVVPDPHLDPETETSSQQLVDKNTSSTLQLSARGAKEALPAQEPATEKPPRCNQTKSSEHPADPKVRPKLNVKPSVMKPAVQVKPGQKMRRAEPSAVAAVKPLSSSTTVQEESLQEPCKNTQGLPSSNGEAQLISAVPHSPTNLLDSGFGSSPLREELQTVPIFMHQETQPAVGDICAVPQSPVLKTPTQLKFRRSSAAAPRATSSTNASTSAVDDFEELINQFTDDHIEEDVDPALGEDDLLQELSEMIDS
ncbi:zinc finger CCCH domain-containing protein 11A [Nothobranchius furzeri]|uniref:Chromosome 12 open reading frame 50 n=1 Tax=Nothobranchius furzeri TaxID=105023 RepID=A0A1A8A4Z7_NOTFU|nr:zinc finger CCCH domain-containing protein 11A-like [Nothobranchius furzeri]